MEAKKKTVTERLIWYLPKYFRWMFRISALNTAFEYFIHMMRLLSSKVRIRPNYCVIINDM